MKKIRIGKDGKQIGMKDLNGEPLPNPRDLVVVSRESIGLPSAEVCKTLPRVKINGGARPGAGRPKSGREAVLYRLIPKAKKKVEIYARKNQVSLSEAAEMLILGAK